LETEAFVGGEYIAAIGGEGRDYATLFEAARGMPDCRFVVVAREHNLLNLHIPRNVTCFTNLPLLDTMNVLQNARIAVIPLLTNRTPCGHVTMVAGMHLGKAQVVSYSEGVVNYIEDGETGLYARAGDAADLKRQMSRLLDDEILRNRIAASALIFAKTFCAESTTVHYFDNIVATLANAQN
jgi:glycosyltransferase involved in cell wall biosynthesis